MFEKIDVDAGDNAETDDSIGDDVGFSSCGNLVDERKAVIGDTGLNVENRRVVGLIFELVTKQLTTHAKKKSTHLTNIVGLLIIWEERANLLNSMSK